MKKKLTLPKKSEMQADKSRDAAAKFLGTVYIVHGWEGNATKYWFPATIKDLSEKGFRVHALDMPNPKQPSIEEWTRFMKKNVKIDADTYFIGHSIGCQTILRFLASQKKHAAGCVFVAGWFDLKEFTYTEIPEIESLVRKGAAPWVNTPIDFAAVKRYAGMITAIFSDNDYYVDLSNASIFKNMLGAKIIIEHSKGHFGEKENVTELPIVVSEIMRMLKSKK